MAINTVEGIVALKSPSFASDPRISDMDELAQFHLAQSAFGTKWIYARALLVLHWLTLDAQGGGSATTSGDGTVGGIKSEKEGALARSYNTIVSSTDEHGYLKSTSFGAELVQLWRAYILSVRTRRLGSI